MFENARSSKTDYFSSRLYGSTHVHLVGIGGVGMIGIALVLHQKGYIVSGSDQSDSESLSKLRDLGVKVYIGHDATNILGANLLVVSGAIPESNVELEQARCVSVPVIHRAKMLAELMRLYRSITVAGSHGKTTVTSVISYILTQSGFDPSFVIGGQISNQGTTAQLGKGSYFIAEADESDGSFCHYHPLFAIVTNIDKEHMSSYNNSYDDLCDSFLRYCHQTPFYGLCVLCSDDPGVKAILPRLERRYLTYGFCEDADFRIRNPVYVDGVMCFDILSKVSGDIVSLKSTLLGFHNVLNVACAYVLTASLGVGVDDFNKYMLSFPGVKKI